MVNGTKGLRRRASLRDRRQTTPESPEEAIDAAEGATAEGATADEATVQPNAVSASGTEARVILRNGRGIDITSREIRLVQLSRIYETASGQQRIRVDDSVRYPLTPGIVAGSDIVDVEALCRAMSDCLARHTMRIASWRPSGLDGGDAARGEPDAPIAVGLCPSVVTQRTVAMSELMPGFSLRLPATFEEAAFAALEPWAMLFAQKVSGLDPSDLAIDWYRPDPQDTGHLVVAATQRHYLAVRQRVVHEAGGEMAALCDAASAALGACRFVVARSLHIPADESGDAADAMACGRAALYPAPVEGVRFTPLDDADVRGDSGYIDEADDGNEDEEADGEDTGSTSDKPFDTKREPRGAEARYRVSAAVRRVAEAERIYHDRRIASRACGDHLASQRFAALWIGERHWRAWSFDAAGATVESIPLPEGGNAIDNLATLRATVPDVLALALVAGEPEALEPAGGMRALREVLRCPVIEFDASSCCIGPACSPQQLGPASAVAFGLALRELMR